MSVNNFISSHDEAVKAIRKSALKNPSKPNAAPKVVSFSDTIQTTIYEVEGTNLLPCRVKLVTAEPSEESSAKKSDFEILVEVANREFFLTK